MTIIPPKVNDRRTIGDPLLPQLHTDVRLDSPPPPAHGLPAALAGLGLRAAASGLAPAALFLPALPPPRARAARRGPLSLEIVSHCWRYSHLLAYQLSSLALFPPGGLQVTMSVYYCREDVDTAALLAAFGRREVPNLRWHWRALPREQLFRRAIGRNHAALNTEADWIWFTDCDLLFREDCLDGLARALQGRRDALVFPREERITTLLEAGDRLLRGAQRDGELLDIPAERFRLQARDRATGPLQITHGDVARACGYCRDIALYQSPSPVWCKAYEDRAFRWLLRSRGTPLDVPGVYRIRHVEKGRYTGSGLNTGLRSRRRRAGSWLKENLSRGKP